ncbi:EAL domain-containing protein [Undibacterium arcticum]
MQSTALAPDALVVEITESLLMGDSTKLTPVFEALLALGVGISIDDFGTGYSSLSYLQRFPIDNIKIDRSFIDGIPGNRDSVALTQAIIAMAHALEMSVTAEGVELESQMRFLKDAGCDEMQGFFISVGRSAQKPSNRCCARPRRVDFFAQRHPLVTLRDYDCLIYRTDGRSSRDCGLTSFAARSMSHDASP